MLLKIKDFLNFRKRNIFKKKNTVLFLIFVF